MLYCLQLALIMLSTIYISFLVHRKTVFDLVHLKASREYPCEFQRTLHTRCQLAVLTIRRMRQALLRHHATLRGGLHTMHAWLITWWRWDMRMDMRDGGDLFFETL